MFTTHNIPKHNIKYNKHFVSQKVRNIFVSYFPFFARGSTYSQELCRATMKMMLLIKLCWGAFEMVALETLYGDHLRFQLSS